METEEWVVWVFERNRINRCTRTSSGGHAAAQPLESAGATGCDAEMSAVIVSAI